MAGTEGLCASYPTIGRTQSMNPDELDDRLEQLYSSAQSASSEGLTQEALRRCEEAMMLLENYGEDTEAHSYADFVMLVGDIQWGAGEYEEAYRAYHRVVQNEPDRLDASVAMGVALFHLCRFTAAQAALEMCSIDLPDDAETWYYLGLLAARRGRHSIGLQFIEMANELDEERYPMPRDVPDEEVTALAGRMIEEVPEPLRGMLKEVPIVFEDQPDEELLFSADPPMDPLILGIFEGMAAGDDARHPQMAAITRVVFYRDNIALFGRKQEKLEEELWSTLRDEIGHFLGLNEEEMAEQGLE